MSQYSINESKKKKKNKGGHRYCQQEVTKCNQEKPRV